MSEAVSSGRAAFESGDWETCVSLLNRAVESVPWDWSLLETRSQCNERRGDLEASHRDLRQMLRLMPASGAAEDSKLLFSTYVRLAQSVYESGDTEQALRYIIMNTSIANNLRVVVPSIDTLEFRMYRLIPFVLSIILYKCSNERPFISLLFHSLNGRCVYSVFFATLIG